MEETKQTSTYDSNLNNNEVDTPGPNFLAELKASAKVGMVCAFAYFVFRMIRHAFLLSRNWYRAQKQTADMNGDQANGTSNAVDIEAREEGI